MIFPFSCISHGCNKPLIHNTDIHNLGHKEKIHDVFVAQDVCAGSMTWQKRKQERRRRRRRRKREGERHNNWEGKRREETVFAMLEAGRECKPYTPYRNNHLPPNIHHSPLSSSSSSSSSSSLLLLQFFSLITLHSTL